jgi:hypothetical protein
MENPKPFEVSFTQEVVAQTAEEAAQIAYKRLQSETKAAGQVRATVHELHGATRVKIAGRMVAAPLRK